MKIMNSNGASQNNSKGYELVTMISNSVKLNEYKELRFVVNKKINEVGELFIKINSGAYNFTDLEIRYEGSAGSTDGLIVPIIFFNKESNPSNKNYVRYLYGGTEYGNWKISIPPELQNDNSFTILFSLSGGSEHSIFCYGFIAVQ